MTTQASVKRSFMLDTLWIAGGIAAGGAVVILGYQAAQLGLASVLHEGFNREAALMGLPLTADTPAYWYLARAGGLLAYLLLWAASCWGIIMSSKAARAVLPPALVFSLHEFLPLLALLFTGVHAAALLGDSYFDFSIGNLLIPFTGPYRPGWTGLGTLAAYLSIVLIASFYVRRQLGRRTWRLLHYASYLAFTLAMVHGIMTGSDSNTSAIQLMYFATGGALLFLTYFRLLTAAGDKTKTA